MVPFWLTSLIAVVMLKDVASAIAALRRVASILSSSGCQSSVYFSSNRRIFRLIGGPNMPLDVMIHPELPRDTVTCSRPTWCP